MTMTAAEKQKAHRQRRAEKFKQMEEELPVLRDKVNALQEENERLRHDLAVNASGRVSRNVAEVREATAKGAPKRYGRSDLETALELGRWSLVIEGATNGDPRMLADAMEFLTAEPDPKREPEDAAMHGMMWLLSDYLRSHIPAAWEEFRGRYLA